MLDKLYWGIIGLLLFPKDGVLGATVSTGSVQDQPFTLNNPLKSGIDSIPELLAKVIELLVLIGTPIAAVFLIYAGLLFVTARGSEDQLSKAKRVFLWTVIGVAILLGASVIADVLKGTIDQVLG
jgi:hypothetical protein